MEEVGPNKEDIISHSVQANKLEIKKKFYEEEQKNFKNSLNQFSQLKNKPVENKIKTIKKISNAQNKIISKDKDKKPLKQKRKQIKRNSNIYDINNFVVQCNSKKINERREIINIPIPVFSELPDNFYQIPEDNLEGSDDVINNLLIY